MASKIVKPNIEQDTIAVSLMRLLDKAGYPHKAVWDKKTGYSVFHISKRTHGNWDWVITPKSHSEVRNMLRTIGPNTVGSTNLPAWNVYRAIAEKVSDELCDLL